MCIRVLKTFFSVLFCCCFVLFRFVRAGAAAAAAADDDDDDILFYFTFVKKLPGATFHRRVSCSLKTLYF